MLDVSRMDKEGLEKWEVYSVTIEPVPIDILNTEEWCPVFGMDECKDSY